MAEYNRRRMRPVSATASIDAPRERVFDFLLDLSARPAFMDHFLTDYRLERLDPVGVGAAARFRLRHSGEWMNSAVIEARAAAPGPRGGPRRALQRGSPRTRSGSSRRAHRPTRPRSR